MKTFLFSLLLLTACAREPKVPTASPVCLNNLRNCLNAFSEDREAFCIDHRPCDAQEWMRLCFQDNETCEVNNGHYQ